MTEPAWMDLEDGMWFKYRGAAVAWRASDYTALFALIFPLNYEVFSDRVGCEEQVTSKDNGVEDGFLPVF